MESILNSFLLVVVSEMGDKTQLLALILMARFKRPWAIMSGILVATLLNHGLAAWLGAKAGELISPDTLRVVLSALFIGFAVWILIPDKDDGLDQSPKYGAFVTTLVMFFLAEMGDKTQLATVALGAKYESMFWVTVGTTAGMLVADGAAVFLGKHLTERISMKWIHIVAALMFAAFGVGIWFGR